MSQENIEQLDTEHLETEQLDTEQLYFKLFSSHMYTYTTNFIPEEYFDEYHFSEPFDVNKTYEKNIFVKKYGDRDESTYEYCLYTVNNDQNQEHKYVVSREVLSEEQQRELAKYCQCLYHSYSWYNPFKYFTCRCCVGCLDSPFPQQYIINKAREYRDKIHL